ncbi:hypothetical protein B484DRAFT_454869 [Ochromonadaceae sp. CCMP2298]|nr:hypothetical protein B484DRAFT_454869 [Ochromonadaceae sp. CCMP2298]
MQALLGVALLLLLCMPLQAFHSHARALPTYANSRAGNIYRQLGMSEDPSSPSPSVLPTLTLLDFLTDSQKLGYVRFVVVGGGAILEAVGTFDNLRVSDSSKGRLATVSLEEPCFECHIRLDEVAQVKHIEVEKFERSLRVTRFLGRDGGTLLSAILHEESAVSVQAWEDMRRKYGETFTPSA